jgi:DNA-directed RNA polymerase specialized sigma24 family protein
MPRMNVEDTLPLDDSSDDELPAGEQHEDSVLNLMRNLKTDRNDAAQQLWNRYYHDLVDAARRLLQGVPKGMADEEDVAASVFRSICRGGEEGRFSDLKNRDELWWLLLALTRQKAVNYIRGETRQKRGEGKVRRETDLTGGPLAAFSLENLIGNAPTPEFLAQMQEEHQRLMLSLKGEELRQVAALRIAGYDIAEIAHRLGLCNRTVLRKLALVRKIWEKELADSTDSDHQAEAPMNAH